MKYKNYVAIQIINKNQAEWIYITEINNSDKTFKAEKSKKAKEFTQSQAKYLIYGLTANLIVARIETFPDFYEIKND